MRAALLACIVLLGSLAALPGVGAAGMGSPGDVGVAGTGPTGDVGAAGTGSDSGAAAAQTDSPPPDPENDVIGWENGVWHNESIPVDQLGLGDEGLTDRETELLVARTMARVEVLRQMEFTRDVTVEFVSREVLQDRVRNMSFGETTNDQVYEAMFVFGEDTEAEIRLQEFLGGAVVGYAAEEGSANLTIVTRSEDLDAVSERVLAHELVHVLQDQHFDLSQSRYRRSTIDGEWGKDGLIEGEAAYIDHLYGTECISNWSCTSPPADWSGASVPGGIGAFGVLSSQPYEDGATFVHDRYDDGGWAAVDAAHQDPPRTTEQIIHRDREREPVPLSVPDRSTEAWEVTHTNTLGEAGLFTMFVAHRSQAPEGKAVLDRTPHEREADWDTLDFDYEATAGWGNDTFRAYENGDRHGYTWTSVWDSERDAKEFVGAYEQALVGLGALRYDEHTFVIEDGPFADAFYVVRENRTVRIVNAPTVEELGAIDSPRGPAESSTLAKLRAKLEAQQETIARLRDRLAAQNETIAELRRESNGDESSVATPWSGGLVVVAIALVAVVLARRVRS